MSKKPNLSAVKTAVHKEKFKHGSLAVVFTVVFIAVIIVINVLVSALTTRFPSMNFDLTKEGLNTLSDEATDVAKEIVNETTIYIIGSEDAIRGDEVYSNYSLKYSQVANLADRLHELNDKIQNELLKPVLKYGILKERMSALLTDGIRAELLESKGYRTQILEFIDMEHTPKNLLIRAVKTGKKQSTDSLAEMTEALHADLILEKLLYPQGIQTEKGAQKP